MFLLDSWYNHILKSLHSGINLHKLYVNELKDIPVSKSLWWWIYLYVLSIWQSIP
jgi:hypothetical protein